jgi:hypothetical protein
MKPRQSPRVELVPLTKLDSFLKSLPYNRYLLKGILPHPDNSEIFISFIEPTSAQTSYVVLRAPLQTKPLPAATSGAELMLNDWCSSKNLDFLGVLPGEPECLFVFRQLEESVSLANTVQSMAGPLSVSTLEKSMNLYQHKLIVAMLQVGADYLLFYKVGRSLKRYSVDLHLLKSAEEFGEVRGCPGKEFVAVLTGVGMTYVVYSM